MTILELLRNNFVIGLDIEHEEKFAYVVAINGIPVEKGYCNEIELIKLLKKYRPIVIAIDNIREIFEHGKKLLKKLSKLPFTTYIVQVTKVKPDREYSVEELVREYLGIDVSKLSPIQTAEYLTKLVCKGIGCIVKIYEPETRITIKAKISTSSGGMSRNRFERNVHHRIKQIVNEIKNVLDRNNIDYDLFYTDSEGVRSATFIVYADKAIVRSLIKLINSIDVKVSIEQVITDSIKFIPLIDQSLSFEIKPVSERYIILGIDPGIVTGLAIIDLSGKVLYLHSGRNLSRRKVLEIAYSYGTPIIVATDVSKPSDYVKKLSSMINAILYIPDKDLSIDEKSEIVSKICLIQKIQVKDPHQRDALAAAYKAYLTYKPKFDRINEEVKKLGIAVPVDEIKALVIKGYSINQAVNYILDKLKQREDVKVIFIHDKSISKKLKEVEESYEKQIKYLQDRVKELEREKEELLRKIEYISDRIYLEVKKDQVVKSLEARLNILEKEVDRYRIEVGNLVNLLKNFENAFEKFLKNELGLCIDSEIEVGKYENIYYCIDSSKVSEIDKYVVNNIVIVKGEVTKELMYKYWLRGIYTISLNDVIVHDFGKFKFIDLNKLNNVIKNIDTLFKQEITEDYLTKLVNEYRSRRFKFRKV